MNYHWYDFVGNIGVAFLIGSYLLLQLGRLDVKTVWYSAANALGAALIIVSLMLDFNLSAFIIEAFWLIISFIGLARFVLQRRAKLR